jgi:hypothetical protein
MAYVLGNGGSNASDSSRSALGSILTVAGTGRAVPSLPYARPIYSASIDGMKDDIHCIWAVPCRKTMNRSTYNRIDEEEHHWSVAIILTIEVLCVCVGLDPPYHRIIDTYVTSSGAMSRSIYM